MYLILALLVLRRKAAFSAAVNRTFNILRCSPKFKNEIFCIYQPSSVHSVVRAHLLACVSEVVPAVREQRISA